MQKLGLVNKFVGRVDPVHFFSTNLRGFLELTGVKFSSFSVKEAPEPMETDAMLIQQETATFDAYTIYLDRSFVAYLRKVSNEYYIGNLWYNFIFNVRMWVIQRDSVPIKDLIAPSVLCDEMTDTEDISEPFFKNYDSGVWGDLEVAQNFDAATVALYIEKLVTEQPEKLNRITYNDVVKLILESRNSNWHQLSN